MVVSKNQPIDQILPLLEAGHRLFGENRVQEAMQKWPSLKERFPDIRLHLIGPLQRNKIKQALGLFTMIETLDRLPLIDSICNHLNLKTSSCPPFLIQMNEAREPQKSGIWPENLQTFFKKCQENSLSIQGFMCIPPHGEDPTPYFKQMHDWREEYNLPFLSMGMSDDYLQAIPYGSSWVRLGTAIFGSRPVVARPSTNKSNNPS